MKKINPILIAAVSVLLLTSCSSRPTAVPVPDTPEPTPELIEPAPTTEENEETPAEEVVFEIEETKTTLLVYSGDARISRDGGETWGLADTGLWLESGDRLQITPGGIAVILFPDGSLIRLEGFSDFELVLIEFDFEGGTKHIIGRIWDGSALVTTVPLPNQESLFQLWSMTSLIDLPFDPEHAVLLDQAETIPEENRLAFGAANREDLDGEILFNFADSVLPDFYSLEIVDGDYILIKTRPIEGQYSYYLIPYRDNLKNEYELEGLLDLAGGVIKKSHTVESIADLDFYGFSMIEEGSLSENQVLYSMIPSEELIEFLMEDPEEKQEFVNFIKSTPSYKRYQLHYRYYKTIPDIFAADILLMIDKYNLGCDIRTGLGCPLPDDCDQGSGSGCELVSGCNPVTREGCEKAKLSCIAYTNCDWAPCGRRPVITHFCKPRVRKYCDPAIPNDCDEYLLSSLDQLAEIGEMNWPTDTSSSADTDSGTSTGTGFGGESGNSQSDQMAFYAIPLELAQNSELAGQPLYDPNESTMLAQFYNNDYWEGLLAYYRSLYGEYGDDRNDEEDIEWCTCTASHEGYPDPPPWIDPTYPCWCSDPGAY